MARWTDYEFETAFLGRRQANVLHRFEVSPDVWHVCYVDANDVYHTAFYQYRPEEGDFQKLTVCRKCDQPEKNGWECGCDPLGAVERCPVCTDAQCTTCCRTPVQRRREHRVPELGTIHSDGGHPEHVPYGVYEDGRD